MEKYLRPERLDCNPSSSSAPDEWQYWHCTFYNFLTALSERELNKLDMLVNLLTPTVYKYVAECVTFEEAIALLEELYVKPKIEMFLGTSFQWGSSKQMNQLLNVSGNWDSCLRIANWRQLQLSNIEISIQGFLHQGTCLSFN